MPRPGQAGPAFRERPLEGACPYLWLDAKVEKVRAGGRVEHRALVVAYGIDARFHDLGAGFYHTRINPERAKRNHIRQLEALGYKVTLQPAA